MKILHPVLLLTFLFSCTAKPYINQSLQAEKTGNCSQPLSPVKMNSNINGERYVFDYCGADGFDAKKYALIRNGDSLILTLPAPARNEKSVLYKLTLDVDAYPKYTHIKLGDQVMDIIPSAN